MTLRRRMYLLGAFGLAPLLAAGAWNEFGNRSLRERELRANLAQDATLVANEFQRQLEGTQSLLQTLAVLPVLRGTAPITCDELFNLVRPQNPTIAALGATDRQGNVVCASDRQPGEILPPIGDRVHFRRALETQGPALGVYAYGRRTAQHVIHLATPYKDGTGQIAGVVFAALSLDAIARRYDTAQWSSDRVLTVIDREGTILLRQPGYAQHVGQKIEPDRWLQLKGYTQPGYYDAVSSVDGVRRVIGFSPLSAEPAGIFVGIGVSRAAAFGPLNEATWRTLGATFIALILSFGSAWLIARNLIGKPWRRILKAAKLLEQGQLDARVRVVGSGEFAQLGYAFNTVADRLVAALARKDLLLRELSHRIMNNLQVITSVLHMQQRAAVQPETKKELQAAAGRVQAVALTYRRLHEIHGVEAVDVGELSSAIGQEIAVSLLARSDLLEIKCDRLMMPPERAMSFALITNELLTNAIKYGGGAQARVWLELRVEGETARLSVSNLAHASPTDSEPASPGGFGKTMIRAMVKELEGMETTAEVEGRYETVVVFPSRAVDS
jgi:two-component sensor histidine kinase